MQGQESPFLAAYLDASNALRENPDLEKQVSVSCVLDPARKGWVLFWAVGMTKWVVAGDIYLHFTTVAGHVGAASMPQGGDFHL